MSNDKASPPKNFSSNWFIEKLHETNFQVIEVVIRCDFTRTTERNLVTRIVQREEKRSCLINIVFVIKLVPLFSSQISNRFSKIDGE